MRTLEVKITNPNGLTSRHGADLVEEANLYKSNITMITSTSNDKADLKSIMDVMATVVNEGEAFTIEIEGEDEDKAYDAFVKLLQTRRRPRCRRSAAMR